MNRILLILLFSSVLPLKTFEQNYIKIDTSQVYTFVDSMPKMHDGLDIPEGFFKFYLKEFKYPDSINCILTNLIFEFTISYNGILTNKKISFPHQDENCIDDIDKLTKAGLDFLDKFPLCLPGKQNGKYVNVKFIFPVHIELQ